MRHDGSVANRSDNVNNLLQMDEYRLTGLKGSYHKWTQRIRTLAGGSGTTIADFYQLFACVPRALVSTGLRGNTNCEPPAARHLTADWDLDQSDLKVPPD